MALFLAFLFGIFSGGHFTPLHGSAIVSPLDDGTTGGMGGG
jgi:hypothetical protein